VILLRLCCHLCCCRLTGTWAIVVSCCLHLLRFALRSLLTAADASKHWSSFSMASSCYITSGAITSLFYIIILVCYQECECGWLLFHYCNSRGYIEHMKTICDESCLVLLMVKCMWFTCIFHLHSKCTQVHFGQNAPQKRQVHFFIGLWNWMDLNCTSRVQVFFAFWSAKQVIGQNAPKMYLDVCTCS